MSPDAYIICATPRTGSTLLCSLLTSTGRAGRPHSYFRHEDRARWSKQWGIAPPRADEPEFPRRFIDAALQFCRGATPIAGLRVMWGSMDDITDSLRALTPDDNLSARELLRGALGDVRFVHLTRDDVVAQAISWERAEATGVWHRTAPNDPTEARTPEYDFAALHRCVQTIQAHNDAWLAWFAAQNISPLTVRYEPLAAHPIDTTRSLLRDLGIELDHDHPIEAPNIKMADAVSKAWAARYRNDLGLPNGC